MKLREIEFGSVWGASGVQGFFGEGYPHHRLFRLLFPRGFSFDGMTFISKTTPTFPNIGNMPLKEDGITPREWNPACIKVKFFRAVALNSVALSGPGAVFLFLKLQWQKRTNPFFISYAPIGATREERIGELRAFVATFLTQIPFFRTQVGLQINFSCPNTGLERFALKEILDSLDIVSRLNIPIVPKLNALFPIVAAKEIAEHPACDALCVSNTIPWGARFQTKDQIDWKGLFGSDISPLAHLGGGGLSGAPLFPLVARWLREAREAGITKPICAGGGILSARDIEILAGLGADAVSLGSVAILRPWRMRSLIETAHRLLPT